MSLLYHIKVNMSIVIYKVNNLFTIERVSVYVSVYGWMCIYRWDVWVGVCGGWLGGGWIRVVVGWVRSS